MQPWCASLAGGRQGWKLDILLELVIVGISRVERGTRGWPVVAGNDDQSFDPNGLATKSGGRGLGCTKSYSIETLSILLLIPT